MFKQFLFGITVFLIMPLYSMKSLQPMNNGLQDVVRNRIQSLLSLQEIARFKRSCKLWNVLGDVEEFCPLSHTFRCSTYACACLIKNYYTCGKALAHFARKAKETAQDEEKRKKDENMFKHLWVHHAVVRDEDVLKILKASTITIHDQMKVYGENYHKEKRLRKHILESATRAICADGGNIDIAKTVLLGNSFDIFDLLGMNSEESCDYTLDFLFFKACQLNDVDVIALLCGGTVNGQSLEYVMKYARSDLIINLICDKKLPIDVADKTRKSVLHYLAQRGDDDSIALVVAKGARINVVDTKGMTPLHYAVKNKHLHVIQKILSYNDVDVLCKNKKGKKPIDYIPMIRWNFSLKVEDAIKFTLIKEALQSYYQTA